VQSRVALNPAKTAPEATFPFSRLSATRHWSYPLEIEGWKDTVARANRAPGELAADLDPWLGPATPAWSSPLLRLRSALGEVQAYLRANAASLVDYARALPGQASASPRPWPNRGSSGSLAGAWPKSSRCVGAGAHRLVQVRLAVLASGLQDVFRRGYPRFPMPVGREATPT
jgi:hypothetical protein